MECVNCKTSTVSEWVWRTADAEQKKKWRTTGIQSRAGRGLCQNCYKHERRVGRLDQWPRTHRAYDDVIEEWSLLYDPSTSLAANIIAHAPRMGMSTHALEKALQRIRAKANSG